MAFSKRLLRDLRATRDWLANEFPDRAAWPIAARAVDTLDGLLQESKPKRSVRAARKRKAAKDAVKLQTWRDIKAQVHERSGFRCELPVDWMSHPSSERRRGATCGASTQDSAPDHFVGGSGNRTAHQSVYTVWDLCRQHHEQRQANEPSAEWWAMQFKEHCLRYSTSAAGDGDVDTSKAYYDAAQFAFRRIAKSQYRSETSAHRTKDELPAAPEAVRSR